MPSNSSVSLPLQAVVFDYGAVLTLAPTLEEWSELAATAGLPVKEFRRAYGLYRPDYDRAACGATAYWQAVTRRPLDAHTLAKLIELDNRHWTRINPEMLALSRRLRQAGIKTAILSNMEFEMLAEMRAKLPWLDEFELQVYSCEVRMAKPDHAIYLHATAELGVQPGETLFIDDKPVNVEGARQVGMKALLFDQPTRQAELEALLNREGIALEEEADAAAAIQ
jgi:putative hydrolase of the HAD superfamily